MSQPINLLTSKMLTDQVTNIKAKNQKCLNAQSKEEVNNYYLCRAVARKIFNFGKKHFESTAAVYRNFVFFES